MHFFPPQVTAPALALSAHDTTLTEQIRHQSSRVSEKKAPSRNKMRDLIACADFICVLRSFSEKAPFSSNTITDYYQFPLSIILDAFVGRLCSYLLWYSFGTFKSVATADLYMVQYSIIFKMPLPWVLLSKWSIIYGLMSSNTGREKKYTVWRKSNDTWWKEVPTVENTI